MLSFARQILHDLTYVLRQTEFWEWLLGILLLVLVVSGLFWFASGQHDTYLRLQPLVCTDGMEDRQFLIVAVLSPVFLLLLLTAVGELWQQLDARRRGRPMHWLYLSLFSGSALILAALILAALRC